MNQQNNQMEADYYRNDDEIDIGQLFTKIWYRKGFIFSFVFISVVMVLGVLSANYFISPPVKESSRVIQLTFSSSSEEGYREYPSGKIFSANDMLASNILTKVYERNQLAKHGVNLQDFISAFSVSPYASNTNFIHKRFKGLLSNKKLTRPEVIELEEDYLAQLQEAQSRFVKISYLENGLTGMNSLLLDKVLKDIPKIWSETAIKEQGVTSIKIFGSDFYQKDLAKELEYIKAASYLSVSAKKLAEGLNILSEDEMGASIINVATGRTVSDLKAMLSSLQTFKIEPLFAKFIGLGIAKSSFDAKLYIENKVHELQSRLTVFQNKAENYRKVLSSYGTQSSNQGQGSNGQTNDEGLYRFDSGTFAQLRELLEDKSDTEYKQTLLEERLIIMQKVEEVNSELSQYERALKVILKKKKPYSDEIIDDTVSRIVPINSQLSALVNEYQQLLDIRNNHLLGSDGSLYSLLSTTMKVDSGLIDFAKKMGLFSGLATFLSLMIAVMIALIRKSPLDNVKTA